MTLRGNVKLLLNRAEFLRGVSWREVSGTDFDSILRSEIRQMHAHLDELDAVDSSTHAVSFYSQATTVDGIRELCSFTEDPDFEKYPAIEFLQVFNVVGVPAAAAIADYPDPAVFH